MSVIQLSQFTPKPKPGPKAPRPPRAGHVTIVSGAYVLPAGLKSIKRTDGEFFGLVSYLGAKFREEGGKVE